MKLKIASAFGFILIFTACSTSLPAEKHDHYDFPKADVYRELPTDSNLNRPYTVLGWVKARAEYPTFEQVEVGGRGLCQNYYNKAAADLFKEAKKAGGDAVIKIRSVVLNLDNSLQEYPTPECSDDGAQGEILLKGVAIKFKEVTPSPTPNSH